MSVLRDTLQALAQRFDTVWFCPGNHDLWLAHDDEGDSLAKLRAILAMCSEIGVSTVPGTLRSGAASLCVCPLLSWHHQSFDAEPDLEGWAVPSAEATMCDYRACHFEGLSQLDDSVAAAVDALNNHAEDEVAASGEQPLVTFSHFLPRSELLLEKRFLLCPQLPKAAGSRFLGERVARMRPSMHVFGHTHFAWDAELDGVRYVQAALAYPAERRARWHTLTVGEMGAAGPLLLWSSDGGFVPKMHCRWSAFYEHHAREPQRTFELAAYAAPYFRKTDPRATVCVPDFSHEDGGAGPAAGMRMRRTDPALDASGE